MEKKYDYLIVGAGLFGATFAYLATQKGKKCLVIDKRNHTGGNTYCEKVGEVNVHKYGAHIFHTSNKKVWKFINKFTEFNNYVNSPIANYKNELYNLPFNMNTFAKLWNISTPEEAKNIIENQKKMYNVDNPSNLEEQAINLVGKDIYEKLIKGYTEKQWGKECKDLPAFIIKRLPVRFTFDNNYFNDLYQGIPINGYNEIIEKMLSKSEVRLNVDFLKHRNEYETIADKIIYTGTIDEYYNYEYGELEYRSLKFETNYLPEVDNYQGVAVMNYTDSETPYTRIIEHKHFEFSTCKGTVITKEYPIKWVKGEEAYYPLNDEKNIAIYEKYKSKASKETNILFGGRLGQYQYFDMHKIIEAAMDLAEKEIA